MLYRVVVNGTDILDHSDPTMVLLSPQLTAEIDVAGSLEFTVPPNHKYYDLFTAESIMAMTIEVYEGEIMHWFGRPMELHLDFYKNKKLYCEGGLSFFNDSVIRENEYENTALSVIFAAVITEHNSMVPTNRQFTVGQFTVDDEVVYRKFNYEQTSDVLKSKFLDAVDGHFFVRRVSGVNYIDLLKDMPYTCNQDVEFAENLLNFTYSFDGKDFATCVIPLGKTDSETQKPIDIKSVNDNSDILVGNTASKYGNIVKVQQYSDIEDPNKLKSEGQKYLTVLQYNAYLIECSAVDLHATDDTKQQFRVGQTVHCISDPHGIDLDLPISKMTLYLDSAAKQITLGRIPKKTLARFYKELTSDTGGGGGVEQENEIPEGWEIVPPDEDGGEPTLKRVPVTIQITRAPYKSTGANAYHDNETFDPSGIEVKLVATGLPNLTYFTDEYYPNNPLYGVPMSELSFEINGSSISTGGTINWASPRLLVWAIWRCQQNGCPYYGRTHRKGFYIENSDAIAREAAGLPDHIQVVNYGGLTRKHFKDGETIDFSGVVVKAFTSDGQVYKGNGYADGVIPLTELTFIPTQADLSSATFDGSVTVDDPENYALGGLSVPIKITDPGSYYYWTPEREHGENSYQKLYATGAQRAAVFRYRENNRYDYLSFYWVSEEPFTTSVCEANNQGVETWRTNNAQQITRHGHSYYQGRTSLWADARVVEYISGDFVDISQTITADDGDIGYLLLYGDMVGYYKQVISVNWKRPDGLTLTTTITIKVSETGEEE